ncbi:DUF2189 domain-containing protein [Magnetospira sp. QH-2]|uniref:DUF2189 domain-containing protein n=1 Tax=Magnetospira sp. (strain QH-2) TaxID=1288970 RepID=UPI0003E80DEB|nr:DUF2189 domain-containing protein [Magnetospira sp. QH-2]CCQ73033.1 conserved membrane protein of unknown function [Magnetospira sp. QH-2]
MTEQATAPAKAGRLADRIRVIDMGEPFVWLGKGWNDLCRSPRMSLAHGVIFTVTGLGLSVGLRLAGMDYLIYPLTAAFLIGGPFLAFGLYDISRKYEAGLLPRPGKCLTAGRHNTYHILTAGLVLMLFAIIWSRFAVLTFALSFPHVGGSLETVIDRILFTMDGWIFLATGTFIGGILAGIAFLFGVITLPMMLDRKVDVFAAAGVSFMVIAKNKGAMLTWAGLIVIFTGAGLATAYIGLAVTLPLIGHASWHAYRACVDAEAWPKTPEG